MAVITANAAELPALSLATTNELTPLTQKFNIREFYVHTEHIQEGQASNMWT
jgi:hypothetical protein